MKYRNFEILFCKFAVKPYYEKLKMVSGNITVIAFGFLWIKGFIRHKKQ